MEAFFRRRLWVPREQFLAGLTNLSGNMFLGCSKTSMFPRCLGVFHTHSERILEDTRYIKKVSDLQLFNESSLKGWPTCNKYSTNFWPYKYEIHSKGVLNETWVGSSVHPSLLWFEIVGTTPIPSLDRSLPLTPRWNIPGFLTSWISHDPRLMIPVRAWRILQAQAIP